MLEKAGVPWFILRKDHFILSATFPQIRQLHTIQRSYHTMPEILQSSSLCLLIQQLFYRIHHDFSLRPCKWIATLARSVMLTDLVI